MIPVTEKRFREGTGVQFLLNGHIRCQGLSKGKLRKWREANDDFVTPKEDLWPECQCVRAAEHGAFACKFHGGMTPKKIAAPRTILDVMPVDLAEKMRVLMQDPQYLNRHGDILLMQSRIWELLEELQEVSGSAEAWGAVGEAITSLKRGNDAEALMMLQQALDDVKRSDKIWDEIRKTEIIVKELTRTQVHTAKELRQMATTEQVMSLVINLYEIMASGAKRYIDDPADRSKLLNELSRAVSRYANLSPEAISTEVEPGRIRIDGEAKHLD